MDIGFSLSFRTLGSRYLSAGFSTVMPALVAGIHAFLVAGKQGVDGRAKPGHDGENYAALAARYGAKRAAKPANLST
jgi:hypothetical protein